MNCLQLRRGSSLSVYRAGVMLVAMLSAGALVAQTQSDVTLINRHAIMYNPATGKVYAVDQPHNAVWVIGPDGTATSVKVGDGPEDIAVLASNGMAYVANVESNTISILDGKTDAVVATVRSPGNPYAIAGDDLANKVYMTHTYSNMLTVIDGARNTATGVKTGSADAIVVDAAAKKVYLMGYESDTLRIVDMPDGAITKVPAGSMHSWGMALDKAAGKLYLTQIRDKGVTSLDVKTHQEKTIPVGTIPSAVAVNEVTGQVYVTNYDDGTVSVIDGKEGRVVATVAVGQHPSAVAVDVKRNLVIVANTKDSTVSLIDGRTRRVLRTVKAGEHPYAIAVDDKAQKIYVANLGKKSFTALSMETR